MVNPLDLFHFAQTAAGRLVVRSALNPLLWFCGVISLPFLYAAIQVRDDRQLMWVLLAVSIGPILLTCIAGGYFALVKPDKLQSEDYQLRQQSIQMLQGREGTQVIEAMTVIANPAAPALPAGENPERGVDR